LRQIATNAIADVREGVMSEGGDALEISDLKDLFEGDFTVAERDPTTWVFEFTSGDHAGYTLTIGGEGFNDGGDFPTTGTVHTIHLANSEHVALDASALDLSAQELHNELDIGGEGDDSDGDTGDTGGDDHDLQGDDGNDHLDGSTHDDGVDAGGGDDDVHGGDGNDAVDGGDGDDDLNGDRGDDDLNGGDGNDHLNGGHGADTLHGGAGDDAEQGDDQNDDLFGDADDDRLAGQAGSDDLEGGTGKDRLSGGAGKDKVDGGEGNDLLAGGGGKDQFAFDKDFGRDTVKDFKPGQDHIDLGGTGLDFADIKISEHSGDAIIKTSEGKIVVDHAGGDLHESDFLF
jgi:Ca2+-binding RTX toxin-like protein